MIRVIEDRWDVDQQERDQQKATHQEIRHSEPPACEPAVKLAEQEGWVFCVGGHGGT